MSKRVSICISVILAVELFLYILFSWIDGSRRLDKCECAVCDIQETDASAAVSYGEANGENR